MRPRKLADERALRLQLGGGDGWAGHPSERVKATFRVQANFADWSGSGRGKRSEALGLALEADRRQSRRQLWPDRAASSRRQLVGRKLLANFGRRWHRPDSKLVVERTRSPSPTTD